MPAIITFIFGLIIGSFLNVCIYRIPRGESISYPPSHCTGCGKRIKPYDLFPVISYIILKGKCRSCGERISIRYP
jgi:leader peptidase (prepilin peptidase)/N-methyltransferase